MNEETKAVKAPLAFLPDLGFNVRREVHFHAKAMQSIKYAHKSVMSGDVPLDVFERWVRVALQSALNEGYRLGRQESEAE